MTEDQTKRSSESSPEGHVHEVYTDHVAVPEVRTGKVDLEGDFHKDQARPHKSSISFDTVAVPGIPHGKMR